MSDSFRFEGCYDPKRRTASMTATVGGDTYRSKRHEVESDAEATEIFAAFVRVVANVRLEDES